MKVVIVGQGPVTLDWPSDHEVWVINGPHMPDQWDRLYQLHSVGHLRDKYGEVFLNGLRAITAPRRLIMVSEHPEIPSAEPYPWFEVLAAHSKPYYLTHSTPLLIAEALVEGAEAIVLDGFSDRPGIEAEKACVEYHVGYARGRGVQVTVTPAYGLFPGAGTVYGLQEAEWIAERS